ncbi:PucR family transcriptional regulator ligand-binding domain-containing protein, partial [Escherichia coli]|nr:PucR family transcriptional regulator ligand-binding domain-containing protein [Escherichia coli]
VKDVLKYKILNSAKIVTGKEYAEKRHIQWISAIEMPVENFVRKNEAVLTTGIGCGDDSEAFKVFVQDVIDSDASA